MIDSHQEMIQTMRQLMENLTMDRTRNRHDRRERSASIASSHRRHNRAPIEVGSVRGSPPRDRRHTEERRPMRTTDRPLQPRFLQREEPPLVEDPFEGTVFQDNVMAAHDEWRALPHESGHVDAYINEFQRIAVMVPEMPERRVVMLFIEELHDRLRGLVKALKPTTLHEAIRTTLDLDTTLVQPQRKNVKEEKSEQQEQPTSSKVEFTPKMEIVSKNELHRKNLCFYCNDPWESGHMCLGKGKIHLIKVEDEEFEDEWEQPTLGIANEGILAYLSGAPKYNPFMFEGTMFRCRIMALLDSGSTHNFLDAGLVDQKGLQCDNFEGFDVTVAGGLTLPCKKKVNQVSILFGEYILCDDFYVMDLKDNNVVLSMQRLHSLGRVTQDVEAMELSFQHKGKQLTLRALKYTLPHQMAAKSMIVWDKEISCEDIYEDFSLHISTKHQGGDEECGKFEVYMRTLVSLVTSKLHKIFFAVFEQLCIVHMKLLKKLQLIWDPRTDKNAELQFMIAWGQAILGREDYNVPLFLG
ncbi:hypothetical protein KI387_043905 [Taxus chinensis]|uniref:Uncharacterized protein n=1 Tax=Taxus chinensis TaxID=29808 RepID=A0AA38GHN1_TAXCH|nr:hypothetical protein KI387_043905 [Taxus chinensis]